MDRWSNDSFSDPKIGKIIWRDIKERCEYRIHPLFGWRPLPNQKLETLQINSRGLRSRELNEQDHRPRCVILGGSVAWGFGSSSNSKTFAYLLENELANTYGVEIAVINLSDQVYSSVEEIKSFIFSVETFNPSYVVSLSGHNDISRGFRGNKFKQFGHEQLAFLNWGIESGLINGLSASSILRGIFIRVSEKLTSIAENKPNYLSQTSFDTSDKENIPLELLKLKMNVINDYCSARDISAVHVLQPYLHFKLNKSEYEARLAENNGKEKTEYFVAKYELFRDSYQNLVDEYDSESIQQVDATRWFDGTDESIFIDPVHFSDRGYEIFTNKFAEYFVSHVLMKDI